jgi:putative FmdB family regulatory protein
MPMYETRCDACGKREQFFRKIADRDNLPPCEICRGTLARIIVAPYIRPDITPYQSPNGDYMVNSRSQRKEDLKRSGAIAWEPGIDKDIARRKEEVKEESFKPIAEAVDNIVTEMAVCGRLES